jgi:predicted alpha/beta hydrolase family esterase
MKNAILIHGICEKKEFYSDAFPSPSNSHWFPWLQKQLLIANIETQTPEMPHPYRPQYSEWKKEFEKFDINGNTVLIGHSCGGGFLVRWLSEKTTKIDHLVLVAPWLDPDRKFTTTFFDFIIDKELVKKSNKVDLLVSDDDDSDVLRSVEKLKKELLGMNIHAFHDKGHFCYNDLHSETFPELLELVL